MKNKGESDMKHNTKELETMSKGELLNLYRQQKNSGKKNILVNLSKSRKLSELMEVMNRSELEQMAKIHPYKEVVIDTMIDEMESHGMQMSRYFAGNYFRIEDFYEFFNALQHKSFFDKIKETVTRKSALPEALPKKIEQAKKLIEFEVRRINSTGKKMEELETQDVDKAVDESRVDIANGEMAKVFNRYAKEAHKDEEFFGKHMEETKAAYTVKAQLIDKYMLTLGDGKEDVARLVANTEFEIYSGKPLYVPYQRTFFSWSL